MKLTNPKVRNVLYCIYSVLNLVLGSVIVFCGATDVFALPVWVTPAAAVLAYLGSGLGFVASANTPVEPAPGTVPARSE